ncbi:MipA/OmpV family protein [Sphingomonas sp. BGYR3]|uniref:MipA/OmpV family protein n=1 Tax=Sphingomonas sp. BGYR3 TaxID=2975483 RepID=UPI0021A7A649|nr:MipA/OmpV family protein [Sphingomonas sp. BGYR3]MDG5489448.1 MipA/OmpV family protein [Sphingomonas sp. BGYR3]
MKVALSGALCALILSAAPALAQEGGAGAPDLDPNRDTLSIGTGIITVPSYEGSDENIVIPEFVLRGQVSRFSFFSRGPMLFVDAIRDQGNPNGIDIGAGPTLGLRLDRTTLIKDPQVEALGKLKTAVELGGWVGVTKTGVITSDYDILSARVSVSTDVAGSHGSYIVTPTIEYGTPLSTKNFVGISVLADYVGKGYGDYYFDISQAGAAASGLSPYSQAGSGWKRWGVNALAVQSLTGDLTGGLSLVGVVGRYQMLGDFKRSPIVAEAGKADQWIAGLGLTYTF